MTFEADLRDHLLGDAQVAAALADGASSESRLYPLARPQGQKNLRAMVYTVIAGGPDEAANLDGDDGDASGALEHVRLQLDIFGKDHDDARALARLVIARMALVSTAQSIYAQRISRSSTQDPDTREAREILDYSVWHCPQ
jgi:hypothetical protein